MTSDLRGPGGPWELSRDGKPKGRYPTVLDAIDDPHQIVCYSAYHAIKHEGWKLALKYDDQEMSP